LRPKLQRRRHIHSSGRRLVSRHHSEQQHQQWRLLPWFGVVEYRINNVSDLRSTVMSLFIARGRRISVGLLASVCLSAAVIGCGSVEHVASRISSAPVVPPSSHKKTSIHKPDHLQLAHFALLRGAPEGLPPRVAEFLPPRGAGVGANWALAQRLPTFIPQVWAVPGRGYLCLVERDKEGTIGLSCSRTSYAIARSMYLSSVPMQSRSNTSHRVTIGLAPDGVRRVLLHTAGSPPQSTLVTQNFFFLEDKRRRPPKYVQLVR
jgi:hypothetical protein